MFNVYYRSLITGRLCRYSVRGMVFEQAEQLLGTINAKRNKHNPAWVGEH